jgi:hypothetical protein
MSRPSSNPPTPTNQTPARQAAYSILFVLMIGSGLSLAMLLAGNRTLAWQICAGFGVLALVVLVFSAFIVGRSH